MKWLGVYSGAELAVFACNVAAKILHAHQAHLNVVEGLSWSPGNRSFGLAELASGSR